MSIGFVPKDGSVPATVIAVPMAEMHGREDKGLPDAKSRRDLARTYLEIQARCWSQLLESGVLPSADEEHIDLFAEEFQKKFLSGEVEAFRTDLESPPWQEIGEVYLRYSCDNSKPRSLDQQLRNALEGAARDKVFVPWSYVMADAAVTGTVSLRRGYQMTKSLIEADAAAIQRLYIDELGRASRDAVEALRLGQLMDSCGKRLIGVTDGFDSASPNSKLLLSIYSGLHEWFVEQLRQKVSRGMRDAFEKGKNLRPPPLGYKLVPKLNPDGTPMLNPNGRVIKERVIDEEAVPHIREAFRLLVKERLSPYKIARRFNELLVMGHRNWRRKSIGDLLRRTDYIGIESDGKTRSVRDRKTGKVRVERRPKEQWQSRQSPHLRLISDELFGEAQQRLQECNEAYTRVSSKPGVSRTEVYPTLLIRPVCKDCGHRLVLANTGKYTSIYCSNGRLGAKGCQLKTCKSVTLFERKIVGFLHQHVLTKDVIEAALLDANRYLVEQASRPQQDVQPILAEIQRVKSARDRLAAVFERETEEGLGVLVEKLRNHERRLKVLQRQLNEAEARNSAPPQPMTSVDVEAMLLDLHTLLNEDVALSAPMLAKLTGPVEVRQGQSTGQKVTPWIVRFRPNINLLIAEAAKRSTDENRGAWQFVAQRPDQQAEFVEIIIDQIPKYELLAPTFKELHDKGNSIQDLAAAYEMPPSQVAKILRYAETGQRPRRDRTKKGTKPKQRRAPRGTYKEISAVVAQLFDENRMTYPQIQEELKKRGIEVAEPTIGRAYKYAHREEIREGLSQPKKPRRGGWSLIAPEKRQQIEHLLREGKLCIKHIAKQVGCAPGTVCRIRDYLASQKPPEDERRTA